MIKFDKLNDEQQREVMGAFYEKRIRVTRDAHGMIDMVDIANILPPKPKPPLNQEGWNKLATIEEKWEAANYEANYENILSDWQTRYNQLNEV
jgi:hypothetical protein